MAKGKDSKSMHASCYGFLCMIEEETKVHIPTKIESGRMFEQICLAPTENGIVCLCATPVQHRVEVNVGLLTLACINTPSQQALKCGVGRQTTPENHNQPITANQTLSKIIVVR